MTQGSDIEIARTAAMLPIREIAEKIGVPKTELIEYGNRKAKAQKLSAT